MKPTSHSVLQIFLTISLLPLICSACRRLPSDVDVFEGGTADFSCKVLNKSEATNVVWTIRYPESYGTYTVVGQPSRNLTLPAETFPVKSTGFYSVSYHYDADQDIKEYGLHVRNVTPIDAQFQFACSLWNQTTNFVKGDFVDITVWPLPVLQCTSDPEVIPDILPPDGIEIELLCTTIVNTSGPVATLAWYANGQQVSSSHNLTNSLSVLLTTLDSGKEFRCVADIETAHKIPSCSIFIPNFVVTSTTILTTTSTTKTISTQPVIKTSPYVSDATVATIKAQHKSISSKTLIIILVVCGVVILYLSSSVCFGIYKSKKSSSGDKTKTKDKESGGTKTISTDAKTNGNKTDTSSTVKKNVTGNKHPNQQDGKQRKQNKQSPRPNSKQGV